MNSSPLIEVAEILKIRNTACHTLLAMTYAGYQTPSLYVGSWSEWSRSGEEIVNESK